MNNTKIVRIKGRKFVLPIVFSKYEYVNKRFSRVLLFWDAVDYRAPKKGEYFLSGAIPQPYKATNDMTQEYLVIKFTDKATPVTTYIKE